MLIFPLDGGTARQKDIHRRKERNSFLTTCALNKFVSGQHVVRNELFSAHVFRNEFLRTHVVRNEFIQTHVVRNEFIQTHVVRT